MSKKEYNGNEIADLLYGRRKKKRIKKVEKVKKPKHWDKDFNSNKLKREQMNSNHAQINAENFGLNAGDLSIDSNTPAIKMEDNEGVYFILDESADLFSESAPTLNDTYYSDVELIDDISDPIIENISAFVSEGETVSVGQITYDVNTTGGNYDLTIKIEFYDGSSWIEQASNLYNLDSDTTGDKTATPVIRETAIYTAGYSDARIKVYVPSQTPPTAKFELWEVLGGGIKAHSKINRVKMESTVLSAGKAVNIYNFDDPEERVELFVGQTGGGLSLRAKFIQSDGSVTYKTISTE